MNCAEFQKVLPYIIETGGNPQEEDHLKTCTVCGDLVSDLKYIAEQAKLLLPMREPSPRVWEGISGVLEREGLARPAAVRLRPATALNPARWGTLGWIGAAAALALIAFALFRVNRVAPAAGELARTPAPATAAPVIDDDDIRLLDAVQQRSPATAATYRESLQDVNAYIADAKKQVAANPGDEEAREHLLQAYDQKTMLYEMALARSLQ